MPREADTSYRMGCTIGDALRFNQPLEPFAIHRIVALHSRLAQRITMDEFEASVKRLSRGIHTLSAAYGCGP